MSPYDKTIVVNSPRGSGGIFCRELMRNNFEAQIVWPRHHLEKFQKDDINICVVRNPYDVLASGFEADYYFMPEQYKDFYMNDFDFIINCQMPRLLSDYYRFMVACKKLDYVTPISFEFLTEQSDKFLNHMSKKFDITFKPNYKTAETIKDQIANQSEISTRVPREKTELRKKVDEYVNNYEPLNHAYKEYLVYRDAIQSTENML
jgi:hypothetical protein